MEPRVPGGLWRRAYGIVWNVIGADDLFVLYEVVGLSDEYHVVSMAQWRRLERRGQLVET